MSPRRITPKAWASHKTLGERLLHLRKAHGWRQVDVANAVGVTGAQVSRWESNIHEPAASRLWLLAQLYGLDDEHGLEGVGGVEKLLHKVLIVGDSKPPKLQPIAPKPPLPRRGHRGSSRQS